jgi:hypothetical protein
MKPPSWSYKTGTHTLCKLKKETWLRIPGNQIPRTLHIAAYTRHRTWGGSWRRWTPNYAPPKGVQTWLTNRPDRGTNKGSDNDEVLLHCDRGHKYQCSSVHTGIRAYLTKYAELYQIQIHFHQHDLRKNDKAHGTVLSTLWETFLVSSVSAVTSSWQKLTIITVELKKAERPYWENAIYRNIYILAASTPSYITT